MIGATFEQARGAMLVDPNPKEGRREKLPTGTQLSRVERAKANGVSRATQEWLDALARDRPDLLAEVNAGRLKVKTAARQAGLIKPPSPLDLLRKAWDRASEQERAAFRGEIGPG